MQVVSRLFNVIFLLIYDVQVLNHSHIKLVTARHQEDLNDTEKTTKGTLRAKDKNIRKKTIGRDRRGQDGV